MRDGKLWIGGGIAGAVSICCYIAAISINWPDNQTGYAASLAVASIFPMMGIVYAYALWDFIAAETESVANRLGLVFMITAFATLLGMLTVQQSVGAGVREITSGLDPEAARALRRGLRLIDHGLDVAWDLLGGAGIILTGYALRKRSGLRWFWGFPLIILGTALVAFNVATFPFPPADRGLIDVGPLIGLFELALSIRLAFLGVRALGNSREPGMIGTEALPRSA